MYFEEPFWVGVFEVIENRKVTAARVVFGAEPKDCELFEYVLRYYTGLHFSPAVDTVVKETSKNPKRIQREARKQTSVSGIGTKSQQAIKLQQDSEISKSLFDEVKMVIILTGASHIGKTVLAQRMLEKYKYPYFSIDHLKMGLIRSGNTDLTPEDDEELTDYLWPIVREIIKTAVENEQNLIVEGCYIPFDWRNSFDELYLQSINALGTVPFWLLPERIPLLGYGRIRLRIPELRKRSGF